MRGLLSALSFTACLATPALALAQEAPAVTPEAAATEQADAGDPWEGFNRSMYGIHDGVDRAVLEPVARGYRAVTNEPIRNGVVNVLRNLRAPVIFANDVLQGEFSRAGTTAVRFGVNTTLGIAGIFDPAHSMGLEYHDEDFGQTLAVWGVASGPYVFVPLVGPTTVRDGAARVVDIALDPLTWADFDEADDVRLARTILSGVAAREALLDTVDDIRRDSLDPYVTIRTSYGLLRESAIQNGPADVEELPEFESIDEQPATETDDNTVTGENDTFDDIGVTEDNSQQVEANQISSSNVSLAKKISAPISAQLSAGEKQ